MDDLLQDKELQRYTCAHIVAASDLAGAWAADQTFRLRYQSPITLITGPVTDNLVGKQYIEKSLGVAALNALQDTEAMVNVVWEATNHAMMTGRRMIPGHLSVGMVV